MSMSIWERLLEKCAGRRLFDKFWEQKLQKDYENQIKRRAEEDTKVKDLTNSGKLLVGPSGEMGQLHSKSSKPATVRHGFGDRPIIKRDDPAQRTPCGNNGNQRLDRYYLVEPPSTSQRPGYATSDPGNDGARDRMLGMSGQPGAARHGKVEQGHNRSASFPAYRSPELVGFGRFRHSVASTDAWLKKKLKEEEEDPTSLYRLPGLEKMLGPHPLSRNGSLGTISARSSTISSPCSCSSRSSSTTYDERTGSIVIRGFESPSSTRASSAPECTIHRRVALDPFPRSCALSTAYSVPVPGKSSMLLLQSATQTESRYKRMRKGPRVIIAEEGEDVENAIMTDSEGTM